MSQSTSRASVFIQTAVIVFAALLIYAVLFPTPPVDKSGSLPAFAVDGWLNGPPPRDLSGKVVLIDVWAWWCGPCMAQMPEMIELYEKYADHGVAFVGLTPDSPVELPKIQAAIDAHPGMRWPTGYGADPTLQSLGWDRKVPTYILVDPSGKIVWSAHSHRGLEDKLIQLLADPSTDAK